jgi:hypothetical protein
MILGIAGLLFCWMPWIGFPCAALALIFGEQQSALQRHHGGQQSGASVPVGGRCL